MSVPAHSARALVPWVLGAEPLARRVARLGCAQVCVLGFVATADVHARCHPNQRVLVHLRTPFVPQ